MEKNEIIVGKIHFLDEKGHIAETVDYTDTESYFNSIRKECNCDMGGFKIETITDLPEILKAVDDIIYGAHGVDNPHSLEWYSKKGE